MSKQSDTPRKDKSESELKEKILHINRCATVVKGGRKFSFSALILVGDGKGNVGVGFAKANELADAIKKGGLIARKSMKKVPVEGTTIPHEIMVRHDGAVIFLKPAKEGAGVIAGSHVRAVFELAGIANVTAKSLGSSNASNQVRAVLKAFDQLKTREEIKKMRGLE